MKGKVNRFSWSLFRDPSNSSSSAYVKGKMFFILDDLNAEFSKRNLLSKVQMLMVKSLKQSDCQDSKSKVQPLLC